MGLRKRQNLKKKKKHKLMFHVGQNKWGKWIEQKVIWAC